MYRAPSPVFDVPEIPTLRRVKPLPKRRRTSDPASHDHLDPGGGDPPPTAPNATDASQQDHDGHGGEQTDGPGAHPPAPDIMTAQMALQAYYMPVLGGVRDLFKQTPPDSRASTPLDLSGALAGLGTGIGYGYGGSGGGGGGGGAQDGREQDDDESAEGDYVDHLQQPGNTKKRKVPANMSGSQHGLDTGSTGSGAEDESTDRGVPTGRERDLDAASYNGGGVGAGGGGGVGGGGGGAATGTGAGLGPQGLQGRGGRRGRLTRATLAGLQHKEMLRSRKRQLAAVLGALAHGDTLALDQALSASYPFVQTGVDYRSGAPVRVRPSRRREARLARALKAYKESLAAGERADHAEGQSQQQLQEGGQPPQASTDKDKNKPPTGPPPAQSPLKEPPLDVPSGEFTFVCHSATSDRLVATKEEVAILHSRIEEELARQAAKAAEAAKQAAAAAALNGPVAKRTDRTKPGAAGKGAANQKGTPDAAATPAKGKGGKKKKRSALANASNPHHLRNYVPSRLPHSGPPSAAQVAQNAQNLLSPLPLRFLSAEIPPRRRKKSEQQQQQQQPPQEHTQGQQKQRQAKPSAPAPLPTLTNPAEEWICPFCEYQLFYGDEASYHRAVRNRKKILRRRRRARERAAAAASGVAPASAAAPAPAPAGAEYDDGQQVDAPLDVGAASSPVKAAKWKEGDRGGRAVAAHA